ncbi:MAG: RimK family alpha-L-glutamate ligase [Promethearchaeia archaeon]
MKTSIITPKPDDPEVKILAKELKKRNYEVDFFIPGKINVKVNIEPFEDFIKDLDPKKALVRGFGAEPIQKIFFRLDVLRSLEKYGIRLINSRESLEIASDKFLTSVFLEKHHIPTPKTTICENAHDALKNFEILGEDVILKPLFGSKGIGVTRINNRAFAENVIYTLADLNYVFYLQEFIEHFNRDIRILVLGNKAVAGMYRVSESWKTNINAGAHSKPLKITSKLEQLAIRAAKAVKTEIAGVDIIESKEGLYVLEVNSIPGFTALQRVTDINVSKKIIDYFLDC